MNDNNLKPSTDESKDPALPKFKPTKKSSHDTDDHLTNTLEWLQHSLGKNTFLCGNPDCGALIIFHSNEKRPIVCIRCGSGINWEEKYITKIKVCPKCNKEYDTNANYCAFHTPLISLIVREVEKQW